MASIEKVLEGMRISKKALGRNAARLIKRTDKSLEELERPIKILKDYNKMMELIKMYPMKKRTLTRYSPPYRNPELH